MEPARAAQVPRGGSARSSCATYGECVEALRVRAESRNLLDGDLDYRFWRLAALDLYILNNNIFTLIPLYERTLAETDDENDAPPTLRRCDPVMSAVECAI